jgi:hypothetical protein
MTGRLHFVPVSGLPYRGRVVVLLIDADDNEHTLRFTATLNQTMPGLFELSTPRRLPAARGSHTIRVTLDDGQSLGGEVGYVSYYRVTFSRPGAAHDRRGHSRRRSGAPGATTRGA